MEQPLVRLCFHIEQSTETDMRITCALITAIALQTSGLAVAQTHDSSLTDAASNAAPPAVERVAPGEERASENLPSRDEVEAKFKHDLDYWQGVIMAYARDARQQTSERVREETKRLRAAWEEANFKLQDLRLAAKDNWQAARGRFETAYSGVENAWSRLSENIANNQPAERQPPGSQPAGRPEQAER